MRIRHCARCDQDHDDLDPKPFEREVEDDEGHVLFTHWARARSPENRS